MAQLLCDGQAGYSTCNTHLVDFDLGILSYILIFALTYVRFDVCSMNHYTKRLDHVESGPRQHITVCNLVSKSHYVKALLGEKMNT